MTDEGKSTAGTSGDDLFDGMLDTPVTGGGEKPESKVETPLSAATPVETPVETVAAKVEAVTDAGSKKVKYHSRRANFGACIRPKQVMRDGQGRLVKEVAAKEILFTRNNFETSGPEEIAWLDAYIKKYGDEVFRMPEIDPLLSGDVTGRLDSMQLDELRAACRSRSVDIIPTDDENALRYKLLRQISGLGQKR